MDSSSQHEERLHRRSHTRRYRRRVVNATGFLRSDGRKGIRNVLIVTYLVECAHHVARRIVDLSDDAQVHLIGFPGCYPNEYALRMMKALATHPNVGGILLLSLGCEGFNREDLAKHVA